MRWHVLSSAPSPSPHLGSVLRQLLWLLEEHLRCAADDGGDVGAGVGTAQRDDGRGDAVDVADQLGLCGGGRGIVREGVSGGGAVGCVGLAGCWRVGMGCGAGRRGGQVSRLCMVVWALQAGS
jgi:hypothetical protein